MDMELTVLGCSLRIPSCHQVGRSLEGFKLQELYLMKEKKGILWRRARCLHRCSIPVRKVLDLTVLV